MHAAEWGICDLAILVRECRLRWFGHVMHSNGEINRVRSRPVPGRKGPGRPKKTWEECVKQDLKVCGLSEAGTQDRLSWRSSVKNSRQEPTPSNGSLPQSMAVPPARRVLGMGTRSFNKTGFDWLIDWMAWCRQATSHYLSQCWPRSLDDNESTCWFVLLFPGCFSRMLATSPSGRTILTIVIRSPGWVRSGRVTGHGVLPSTEHWRWGDQSKLHNTILSNP